MKISWIQNRANNEIWSQRIDRTIDIRGREPADAVIRLGPHWHRVEGVDNCLIDGGRR